MNTKEKIVQVAGRMFAEKGFDGVSVRDIVREAGVNLGAITYHFGTKQALFEYIIEQKTIQPLKDIIGATGKLGCAPEERLRMMLEAMAMQILHKDPELKVFFMELLYGGNRLPKFAVEGLLLRNEAFKSLLNEGVKKGVFRKMDSQYIAWNFFGLLSSYILLSPLMKSVDRHGRYAKDEVRRIVDSIMDLFLNGILVKGAR